MPPKSLSTRSVVQARCLRYLGVNDDVARVVVNRCETDPTRSRVIRRCPSKKRGDTIFDLFQQQQQRPAQSGKQERLGRERGQKFTGQGRDK